MGRCMSEGADCNRSTEHVVAQCSQYRATHDVSLRVRRRRSRPVHERYPQANATEACPCRGQVIVMVSTSTGSRPGSLSPTYRVHRRTKWLRIHERTRRVRRGSDVHRYVKHPEKKKGKKGYGNLTQDIETSVFFIVPFRPLLGPAVCCAEQCFYRILMLLACSYLSGQRCAAQHSTGQASGPFCSLALSLCIFDHPEQHW